jgi:plasmid stabilization system protein ParE
VNVVLGDAAKIELEGAIEWYELQQEGLGKRFALAFHSTVSVIRSFPSLNSELAKNIRRAIVKEFPYGIIYSVKSDFIEIIAVAHLHRRPMYWTGRK